MPAPAPESLPAMVNATRMLRFGAMTLVQTIASRAESDRFTRAIRVASVLFITALTAAAAQISIPLPFTEVPFTFQPMVVLIGGFALGPRLGVASQLLYLAAGIAGLPVFAASPLLPPGAARLFGPTGGYLMAYPLAAFATGYLGTRGFDRRYLTSFAAMVAGLAIVFTGGVLWLSLQVGLQSALVAGFYPFIIKDTIKLALAAGVMPGIWKVLRPSKHE
jgi:biotin transport system substrate-specific component